VPADERKSSADEPTQGPSISLPISLPMGSAEVQAILPHRYPFLFLDQVIELEPGVRAVGIKAVSGGEPFFPGHFPGLFGTEQGPEIYFGHPYSHNLYHGAGFRRAGGIYSGR